ncbi:MAG: hypothetical protein HC915_12630 [Anaerolineae bacterium]|nr:hypothetical protein [Anaerolineae bacterium]
MPDCHVLTLPADRTPGLYWLVAGVFERNFPYWTATDPTGNPLGETTPIAALKVPLPPPDDAPAQTLDATFQEPGGVTLRLLGYTLQGELAPGAAVQVRLFWQSDGPAQRAYTLFCT